MMAKTITTTEHDTVDNYYSTRRKAKPWRGRVSHFKRNLVFEVPMDGTPYQAPPLVQREHDTELDLSFFSQMALEALPVDKDREAWISFICRHPLPLTHFLTISFLRPYRNHISKEALRHLLNCLSRKLFGKGVIKHRLGLTGFVIAEPHEISYDKEGCLHFHLLVGASEGVLDSNGLASALLYALKQPKDRFGRQMCVPEITDMKEIDNLKGAARYVTKNFSKNKWAKGEGIYFITPDGLDGDVAPDIANCIFLRLDNYRFQA